MSSDWKEREEQFFIIDSDSLETVKDTMYGYMISGSGIITGLPQDNTVYDCGAYLTIQKTGDRIIIHQDFMGCLGLYCYRDGEYFALSNSFLYLADHVRKSHPVTLNKAFADYLITAELCPVTCRETAVKEIALIDRSAVVEINIPKKSLDFELKDYLEDTVPLDSSDGISLLDKWYCRWTGLIKSLVDAGAPLTAELSGGFDSRITFMLALSSGADISKINVSSREDDLHTHSEDYEIASMIAKHFGFTLNAHPNPPTMSYFRPREVLNNSLYHKACIHKQLYFKAYRYDSPRYLLPGIGGGCLRDMSKWCSGREQYISTAMRRSKRYDESLQDSVKEILERTFDDLYEKYRAFGREIDSPPLLAATLYRETRNRSHFCKAVAENLYANLYTLTPLMDLSLHKLLPAINGVFSGDLLYAVILDRFCPALTEIKFEGGRSFKDEVLSEARRINSEFPFSIPEATVTEDPVLPSGLPVPEYKAKKITSAAMNGLIKKAFSSDAMKKCFLSLYNEALYEKLISASDKTEFFPLSDINAAVGVCRLIGQERETPADEIIRYAETPVPEETDIDSLPERYRDILERLRPYYTLRTDVRIIGEGSLELIDSSDGSLSVLCPSWLAKEGQGVMLHSTAGELSASFVCRGSGELRILLRGKYTSASDYPSGPVWIEYQRFAVNGIPVFDSPKVISHDNNFRHQIRFYDGEIVHISLSWKPHCIERKNEG